MCLTGTPHYRTLFENAIASCHETFLEIEDARDICGQLQQLNGIAFEKCCAAAERNENTINVLTHGDCWLNNWMFPEGAATAAATTPPLFVSAANFLLEKREKNCTHFRLFLFRFVARFPNVLLWIADLGCLLFLVYIIK